jgi:tetratricopeptide (TPR) repeat protein
MNPVQRNLLIGIALAALLGAGIFVSTKHLGPTSDGSPTATTTITGSGNGYTIEQVEIPAPSLGRPVSYAPNLSAEALASVRSHIENARKLLKEDPTRVDLWLQLGVYYKVAGDYQAAAEAWNYTASVAPSNITYVAYGNLGDLYLNFLKDYPKAEANYKAAIDIKPNIIEYYRGLFTLYFHIQKDRAAAAAIVEQGLQAYPDNPDLLQLKSQL